MTRRAGIQEATPAVTLTRAAAIPSDIKSAMLLVIASRSMMNRNPPGHVFEDRRLGAIVMLKLANHATLKDDLHLK